MKRFYNGLQRLTTRGWFLLLITVLNGAAFVILFSLEAQFEALAGVPTFDTQNDLTAALLLEQLPLYTGAARAAYLRFAAFDFVFPLVAAVFIIVWWIVLLRLNTWASAGILLRRGLPLLALLTTLWDYLENVGFLLILNGAADPLVIEAALLFKRLKLIWLLLSGVGTLLLVLFLAANVVQRLLNQRRVTT